MKTTTKTYLSETVNFGGELMSRSRMIAELRKLTGGSEQLVDRYLQGQELGERARGKGLAQRCARPT